MTRKGKIENEAPRARVKSAKEEILSGLDRHPFAQRRAGPEPESSAYEKSVAFKITADSHLAMKRAALDRGTTLSAVLEEAVGEWLAKSLAPKAPR